MSKNNILLLGSKSSSRRMLLDKAKIPYKVLSQDADETFCDWNMPLAQLVQTIAIHKMEHVILPSTASENDIIFVLTADTLAQDMYGTTHGKPVDYEDAIAKVKVQRAGAHLQTAFCLDKKLWYDGKWHTKERILRLVYAFYVVDIPDAWIDRYFKLSNGLQCAGAIEVDGYGSQFLKIVQGSYSTIIGLPLFELRESLESIGFFD